MSAHTPGPWETSSNANGQWDICEQHGGDRIALVDLQDAQKDGGRSHITEESNARLIAAAPELLAALQLLTVAVHDAGKEGATPIADAETEARAAIAKAGGRA